jgi:anti-sigma factor RsiW
MDDELSRMELEELESHLAACPTCAREWRILSMPRRIGEAIPALAPSPHFYQKLRARIASEETQAINVWQILLALSRPIVPALAVVTLMLVSVFAYMQLREAEVDVYQAYEGIFAPGDQAERMVIEDEEELTDEALLRALAGNG